MSAVGLLGLAEINGYPAGYFGYQRMGTIGNHQDGPAKGQCGARIGGDAIAAGRRYQHDKARFIARLCSLQ